VPVATFTIEVFKTGYGRAIIDDVEIADGIATELDFELIADGLEA
jgi:hypothetical protein